MKAHLYVSTELATELREARKKKGYRQEDLALEGFLSTGTISRIERGSVSVSREKVVFLSEQLGVEIQKYQAIEEGEDPVDLSLKLLSIENHLNMVSPDEAWDELRKIHPETEYHRVWALYLKGRYWERKGKAEKAKVIYLQVVENDDPELRKYNFIAASYHALGRICFYEDEMEKSLMYTDKGLAKFYQDGDREHIYPFLSISKVLYLECLNRNEEALLELEDLWAMRDNITSREVILNMYEMKTKILTKLHRFEEAIKLATEGLTMARINRRYSHASYLWIALGNCYNQQGHLQNAETCFHSAVNMIDKIQDKFLIIETYTEMGKLYQKTNHPQKALNMFSLAVRTSRKSSNQLRLAHSLEYLGDYYIQHEKIEKARAVYEESLDIYQKQEKFRHIKRLLIKVAGCYRQFDQKKYYHLLDQHYQIYLHGERS
ncbi:helix-turn-helix domain-containing protein [Shimazuella kribbensis]|uniref:helix-turn-helix domain-containing protein n=1 Tax=Shimazuella kribbensis TaxID=139808 RepID=UPI00040470E0|nr:helix-turn-helix transcriptional regulator [Shimazuella kribbensis]